MAQADITSDGEIAVWTDWVEKDTIKAVAGARWNAEQRVWRVPLSWASCLALRGLFGSNLTLGQALVDWGFRERAERVDPCLRIREAVSLDQLQDLLDSHPTARAYAEQIISWRGVLPEPLFPFQEVGILFQALAQQDALTDEMGTGKTVQTILAARLLETFHHDAFPVLVICPNSIKGNWRREWSMWDHKLDPTVEFVVIEGGPKRKQQLFADAADMIAQGLPVVVIINIEAVRLHSRLAGYGSIALKADETKPKELNQLGFRTVIVDEAHRMKDPKSKQARAIWAVQHGPDVRYRFGLTGTPIGNHPGELWSIMHGIAPQDFPAKTRFVDRYCLQSWSPFGGLDIVGLRPDTAAEFHGFFDPRMRRMPKELVLPFLPPKTRIIRRVGMHPKQAKAYREMEERMATRLDDGSVVMSTNNLARNTRLMQFSSAYATVGADGEVTLEDVKGTDTSGPTKLDALMELVEEVGDQSLVVAAESRQLIELAAARLEKAKITHGLIVGGMTVTERDQVIDDFQAGRIQVVLMTLKAGGVGITLTRARVMAFLQRSWSMIDNKQGEDRVHRIGSEQHDNVVIVDFITEGTIEEMQIPKLHAKFDRLQEIVRDIDVMRAQGVDTTALEQEHQAIMESTLVGDNGS